MTKPDLTVQALRESAAEFTKIVSEQLHPELFGTTDGKAVGTYVEHGFRDYLSKSFQFEQGNSAEGIDFPSLGVDLKVTSIAQPQSSCPFKSARDKVYGLGYSLLVFVYDKKDIQDSRSVRLSILHAVFVDASRTADHQTTKGLRRVLDEEGNKEDIAAFLLERNLPLDEIGANALADEIGRVRPELGYLTISNAFQWRLQYQRVIELAGSVDGISRIR
ncbi:restriction endonuclease [candidate division KSB1 bacterium]|nr:restriction endonuclease [candidate division KSB1 bacterium]